MEPVVDAGAMPATESENIRLMVMAGLADDVDEVNQQAAPMYSLPAAGALKGRALGLCVGAGG